MAVPASPFRSFWMGGYEGADHVNERGRPLDMVAESGHLLRLEHDFEAAAALGFRTVRESVGWRTSEPEPGRFDLSRLRRVGEAAGRHGVQVIWTLMHYGSPADVDLGDDRLIDRLAAFATAVARVLVDMPGASPPIYNPVNEIGFVAWAAAETSIFGRRQRSGDTAQSALVEGYRVKRRLVRATLAAIDAIRAVDPDARFIHVEPLVHVVAPVDRPELADFAAQVAAYQWQAWDLLAGRLEPGLGGSDAALDLIGVNLYHTSQWEVVSEARLAWDPADARRLPFADQLAQAWRRYGRPIVVAETSHYGDGRVRWLDAVAAEVVRAIERGVPVQGLCLYPLVDRPDWSDPAHWHNSGLWDHDGDLGRLRLDAAYAAAIARWRRRLPGSGA